MTQLLVSVRSVAEAETALAGGADIIDVKEPRRGALGRAGDEVVAAITERVAGRHCVSAALGELLHLPATLTLPRCDFVKIGLSGCAAQPDWPEELADLASRAMPRLVAVAYADAARAESPPIHAVLNFAARHGLAALLIDTWRKDGRGLLQWCGVSELAEFRRICADVGIPLALAGSLTQADIERLLPLEPDIIAVRGAACRGGQREAVIDLESVRRLVSLVGETGHSSCLVGGITNLSYQQSRES